MRAEITAMSILKVQAIVEADGELHLAGLPYRKGQLVEATLHVEESSEERERRREEALKRMLERSEKSQFRSEGPYPTRDELHERR
jgi:hypothetical protein